MPESSNLRSRMEKLTQQEIFLLRKRMVFVWIFAIFIGAIAAQFLFSDMFSDMRVPLMIFSIFFFGILIFIVFIHTKNAFQTNTIIYSGKVTKKKTEASRMKNSQLNETFHMAVEGKWFEVEMAYFQKVHVGDLVEVFTLGKQRIFKVERKMDENFSDTEHIKLDVYSAVAEFTEGLSPENKKILGNGILKALLLRIILGGIMCYFTCGMLLVVLYLLHLNGPYFLYGYYGIWIFIIVSFLAINMKTIRLIVDYLSGEKKVMIDKVIDLVKSTHHKNSPHSISTTYRSGYETRMLCYVQTAKFWLPVREELYDQLIVGQAVEIHLGKRSELVLEVRTKK